MRKVAGSTACEASRPKPVSHFIESLGLYDVPNAADQPGSKLVGEKHSLKCVNVFFCCCFYLIFFCCA